MIVWLVRDNMVNIENEIFQWDSFLSKEEYDFVWQEFDKYNWEFIAGEHHRKQTTPLRVFWFKDLIESKIEPLFKSKIEQFIGLKIRTNRFYGNGQAHGQDAFIHTDQEILGNEMDNLQYGSLVYFLHKNWQPHFGGHLIFTDNSTNNIPRVTASIFPHSNSAVMFNSRTKHMAFSPSIYCTDMRLSIAHKFCISKNQE
jgi:hypothetical protein